ncbi:MAG: methionine--tRNA ligase [Candidatus Taylorbacteria bacterium]|nr:methionine--tRNA ligase [Candidatus Taylorbacteria bacterium]
MKNKTFYITTTLPYVNAEPHIGFAMEIIRADIIARWKKLLGYDVFFNTGTDEHGLKIYRKAQELNIPVQKYCDEAAQKFKDLTNMLGISPEVNFIRTTDPHHIAAAQEFWKRVDKGGFIYKKNYSVKYCVGCELEKTDSELINGRCPLHPLQDLEIIEEENYFFKFSVFQQKLLDMYEKNPSFVLPDFRFNEIKAFVKRGLEDFSISRLASKMPWGVVVPRDESQVMFVWFDALINYISSTGWPDCVADFERRWVNADGVVQYCGKDNLRQQSAMWQAMLMAAGLPNSKTIVIDGFITGEGGVKMSKSLGNTVNPLKIVTQYGKEALRYYLAREVSSFEDSPFTMEKFKEAYNAGLANGIGNLVSRVMKMAQDNLEAPIKVPVSVGDATSGAIPDDFKAAIERFDIHAASNIIWQHISEADHIIQDRQPFKLIKTDKVAAQGIIRDLCVRLFVIAQMLGPILPDTSGTIKELIKTNKTPATPLFVRK